MKKKKEKYVPKIGITGVGEDYNVYILKASERIIGYLIGFLAGAIATHIIFGVLLADIVLGIIIGFVAVPIYRNYLNKKRKKAILMQFRDLLDSLSNSFSAGKNTLDSFADAYGDMKMSYGENAPITMEVGIILNGLHNNFVIENLLADMAVRCGIDDINSFAETFGVCNRLGGNLKKIVSESRDIITGKIEIEMEIQTTISSNKNEMNIMSLMPFIIIAMMGSLGNDALTANTPANIVIKCVAIAMFILAYYVGMKITDIKV